MPSERAVRPPSLRQLVEQRGRLVKRRIGRQRALQQKDPPPDPLSLLSRSEPDRPLPTRRFRFAPYLTRKDGSIATPQSNAER